MEKRITVKEVANLAGVSRTTVSRVLNNFPYINHSTKQNVLAAVKTLGYEPDQIARSLIKQKTRTIGLIIDDVSNSFFAETAKIIIKTARQYNYDVIINDAKKENLDKVLKKLQEKRVCGVLIGSIVRNHSNIIMEEFEFPIVLYNCDVDRSNVYSIMVDNKKGSFLAVEHLYGLGHRKIAFISGPLTQSTFYERFIGYLQSLEHFGLIYDQDLVYSGQYSYDHLFEFVKGLLSRIDKPTCFFVSSDQMAIDVLGSISQQGFDIPKDISVVGFDDINISSNPYLSLTTISNEKTEMATNAIKELINLIEGQSVFTKSLKIKLDPTIIVRNTTCGINAQDSF
jgi:LacI family transcriptional regulator